MLLIKHEFLNTVTQKSLYHSYSGFSLDCASRDISRTGNSQDDNPHYDDRKLVTSIKSAFLLRVLPRIIRNLCLIILKMPQKLL